MQNIILTAGGVMQDEGMFFARLYSRCKKN